MDIKELNLALIAILNKRIALSKLSYDDKTYDQIEEELHDLEDDLVDEYGDELEEIFTEIHEKHCPDTDVLLATGYLPKKANLVDGKFDVDGKEGVVVDSDKYPGKDVRLVLLPSPVRILLVVGKEKQVIWNGE